MNYILFVYYTTPCGRTFNNDLTKNKNRFIDTFLTMSPKAKSESSLIDLNDIKWHEWN